MEIQLKTTIPGPKSEALMHRRKASVARGPFHTTPIFASSAKGAWITDVDGNTFLDFSSGIGVTNVGHSPDAVVDAINVQAAKFLHTSFNVVPYEGYVAVCEKLNAAVPGDFAKKSFLANSGAEAVENAVKIARYFTKRETIVCFEHGYHGRTYMAMALTAKEKPYKEGFGPFPAPVLRVPFPYLYRWKTCSDSQSVSEDCFQEMVSQIEANGGSRKVAALLIEPVLGEGGFIPAPILFLKLLRKYCDDTGILLIFDEIQTGFGRTGTLFATEQLGVYPDMLVSAKGIAAGLPLSAVTGRAEVMDSPGDGGIGGTYGGNPVACAAALSVFSLFEHASTWNHSQELTQTLMRRLESWKERFPFIGDVRGLGPMQALELVKDRICKEPDPVRTKALIKSAYENGVILMNAGTYGNVIRFLVPLCMTAKECEQGLTVLERLFILQR